MGTGYGGRQRHDSQNPTESAWHNSKNFKSNGRNLSSPRAFTKNKNEKETTDKGMRNRDVLPNTPATFSGFVQSIGIGLTVAFGGLVFAISFATLVFDGPDAPAGALAAGASFVLWGGAATALIVAARSSLPAIAEVQDGPSAIFAVMAAAIYGTEGIEETAKLPTLEAAIVLTTVATGLLMSTLGQYKLGNIVRLLPSPVTGGFLAGTGWVLSAGAFKVLSGGLPLSLENLKIFFIGGKAHSFEQLMFVGVPGILLGITLAVGNRRIGKFWVVPACLSGGVGLYFTVLSALGISKEDALTRGYLLGPFPEMNPTRRFGFFLDSSVGDALSLSGKAADAAQQGLFGTSFNPLLLHPETLLNKVRWDVVMDQAPGAVAVFGLSTLGVLLITSAVELSTERDGDANDELKAVGLANVVSGLGGGFVGYHSLSSTQIAHGMGSTSRVPGATCAIAYVAALFVGPAPLAYVPSALIGGLLLFIGSSFLYEWVVEGRERLPKSEYAVVLLIVVTVASQGYIAGVAAGVLGAAAVFVSDYSKVPVVRSRLRLGQLGGVRSSAPRIRKEVDVINKRGQRTFGAKLQGFLFFATSYKVLEQIQEAHEVLLLQSEAISSGTSLTGSMDEGFGTNPNSAQRKYPYGPNGLSHIILDFSAVVGVDGSAIAVFEKMRRWAKREGVTLVLCDCDRVELARVLDITLSGEAQPTFAFVDRPSFGVGKNGNKNVLLPPNLSGLAEDVGDGLVACDVNGIVVQTTDLDAALRFTEASLLYLEAEEVAARAECEMEGGSIGDWSPGDSFYDEDEENMEASRYFTFNDVCESVCQTKDEYVAFRAAWEPVVFTENSVVCERGEVADRIYWIENAVVVVETGGRVTEDVFLSDADSSIDDGDESGSDDNNDSPEKETSNNTYENTAVDPSGGVKTGVTAAVTAVTAAVTAVTATTNPELTQAINPAELTQQALAVSGAAGTVVESSGQSVIAAAAAGAASLAGAAGNLRERLSNKGGDDEDSAGERTSDEGSIDEGSDSGTTDEEPTASTTDQSTTDTEKATEIANANRASYGISVTQDFMGAVGFYRRGGVGKVRFGRIVVREPGDGYMLTSEALDELEDSHPKLALRLHKLMAGTLANQVVSRNKLITQFVK